MNHPAAGRSRRSFTGIAFGEKPYYRHQWLASGRVTTDDNLPFMKSPRWRRTRPVPDGISRPAGLRYVLCVHRSCRPPGLEGCRAALRNDHRPWIEVLTHGRPTPKVFPAQAGDFLHYRRRGKRLTRPSRLCKAARAVPHKYTDAGRRRGTQLVVYPSRPGDEVSVVIAPPCADGSASTKPCLWKSRISDDTAAGFTLLEANPP